MEKNVNLVECSGRLTYKRYNEETKQLFLVVYIAVPRVTRKRQGTDVMRDAPGFVYNGQDAEEMNEKLQINDKITLIGHADTEQTMEYRGNRTYRQVFRTSLIADSILFGHGLAYDNTAILAGKILRVYRNPDQGKRFYIITIETKNGDEKTRTSFTYFDSGMHLEPKVNDYIHAIGSIHVKHETDGNNGRERILTTIVARTAGMYEREKEKTFKSENEKNSRPEKHISTVHRRQPEKNENKNVVDAFPVEPEEREEISSTIDGWDSF